MFFTILIGMLGLVLFIVLGSVFLGAGLTYALLGLLILGALVVRWPTFGFFAALIATLLIEEDPLPLAFNLSNIYVFHWPPGLEGLPDRPIGFFLLFILVVLIIHRVLKREKILRGGELILPFLFFLLCVVWGIVHGLSTGGDFKLMVNEVRSFWYLFLGYLLAYNLLRSKKHLRLFFWCIIICAAIKALEALYIYLFIIHGDLADNHQIMAHEESYFWVAALLLVALFSLYYKYKPQFYTALLFVPLLLFALVANNRRADLAALLVGLVVAWVIIFAIKPEARKFLLILLGFSLLLSGVYVAVFYNVPGVLGDPAHAVVSIVFPDASTQASNAYRDIENLDLRYTVQLNPLGLGFGKPFLEPVLLPDISALDPVYTVIPHNTIYWVWMRLGPVGYLALWYLFGSIIVRGCIYARQLKDSYLRLTAIFVVALVIMEIIVAFADYQLFFYRNVIYVGILAGMLLKLPMLDKDEAVA